MTNQKALTFCMISLSNYNLAGVGVMIFGSKHNLQKRVAECVHQPTTLLMEG